jgi:hypothetical protein
MMRYLVRMARQRAPRISEGIRSTFTIPPALHAIAIELAEAQGTTPNDMLVRLAEGGARAYERERQITQLAEARRRAVLDSLGSIPRIDELPDPAEMERAVSAARRLP